MMQKERLHVSTQGLRICQHAVFRVYLCAGAHQFTGSLQSLPHLTLHRQPQQCLDNLMGEVPKLLLGPRPRAAVDHGSEDVHSNSRAVQKSMPGGRDTVTSYGCFNGVILTRIKQNHQLFFVFLK